MGQSASTLATPAATTCHRSSKSRSTFFAAATLVSPTSNINGGAEDPDELNASVKFDYSLSLPDECLAYIFQSLSSGDRKRCSLVCRRWLQIEGQNRQRLSLNAQVDLLSAVPALFSRYDSVTKLALKCDRRLTSINDETLVLISLKCPNLTRLKLRTCRALTDAGISELAKNCKQLKKLSCGSCTFGAKGMNALLDNCSSLEEISIKRLRSIDAESIGTGLMTSSLKSITLKDVHNAQRFNPLIIGSKNLKTLKLFHCAGDWDSLLESMPNNLIELNEVHLERLQVSDAGLIALSKCSNLEILHLVKTSECSNIGLASVAVNCKLMRKLHIDGMKTNRIGDEGLISVAKYCSNLQELVLIGVNPTTISLEKLGTNCLGLERLALCGSESVGDPELACIAVKCVALRKLCIKSCPVTDQGIEALANGCPNLVKVKVKKCKLVTREAADWLRASRGSLAVNLDALENIDASASDNGVREGIVENVQVGPGVNIGSTSTRRSSSSYKSRLNLFSGKSWVACSFKKWTGFGGNSRSN